MRAWRLIHRITLLTEYPPFSLPGIEKLIEQEEIDCRRCGTTLELYYRKPYCPFCGKFVKFNADGTQK
ncbi:hypothetical protein ABZ342_33120 [Amycolatopsis sp. NPDC005961]|uniref:hypothetical protein n=1 Tax=Amycolatopsis sp. NPDC005961 TaxID=3156720 RepID=UPI0033DC4561